MNCEMLAENTALTPLVIGASNEKIKALRQRRDLALDGVFDIDTLSAARLCLELNPVADAVVHR